ncbi:MAG: hypothetical protein Q4G00_17155, partial [Clostridia bacterium]|nr:hypothetical protein [Clostridia bacterium]
MSLQWEEEVRNMENCGKPIVITSRIHDGIVTLHDAIPANVLSGDTLNPHKARILLMLALTKTHDIPTIRRMFETSLFQISMDYGSSLPLIIPLNRE